MHTFYTGCPVVRQTEETFVQYVTVGGQRQRIAFTKQVHWLQESETVVEFAHGGEVLKQVATYSDFYGYLTSFRTDIDKHSLLQLMAKYAMTRHSTLELRLFVSVYLRPVVETEDCAKHNRERNERTKARYASVPDDWRKELVEDGQTVWPMLGNVELGNGIAWTSRNSDEENEALADEFRAKWALPKAAS